MKTIRLAIAAAITMFALLTTSCVTTYDAYGRPMQTVDPGVAVAGVAAAGLVGYAIGQNNNGHHGSRGYYGGGYSQGYGGGYSIDQMSYYGGPHSYAIDRLSSPRNNAQYGYTR